MDEYKNDLLKLILSGIFTAVALFLLSYVFACRLFDNTAANFFANMGLRALFISVIAAFVTGTVKLYKIYRQ